MTINLAMKDFHERVSKAKRANCILVCSFEEGNSLKCQRYLVEPGGEAALYICHSKSLHLIHLAILHTLPQ